MQFVHDQDGKSRLIDAAGRTMFSFQTDGTIGVHNGNSVPDGKLRINPASKALEHHDGTQFIPVARTSANNGNAVSVTTSATTLAVTFATAEKDANYNVHPSTSWGTTVFVTNRTKTGFTLNFGTAAPASSTVDYSLVR